MRTGLAGSIRSSCSMLLLTAMLAACGKTASDAPQYTTVKVDRGDVVSTVTAGGTLQALVTVQVGTQASGRLTEINVDFNSPVKKGQIIARIDPQTYQMAVLNARANVLAGQGGLANAKAAELDADRQARRAAGLLPAGLISQQDADTASANLEKAKANVVAARGQMAQAQAQLKSAEVNLSYTVITSPTDGVVITRSVDVGQTVAASLQAPTLFTIAQDMKKMQVHTSVAESDVGQLKEGGVAEFTVDAYPGQKFTGRVSQVRVSPTTVQNVVTYDAVVDVDNPDLHLKPGMTANVTFRTAELHDTLRVPNAALRFKPPADVMKAIFEQRRKEHAAAGGADNAAATKPETGGEQRGGGGGKGVHAQAPDVKRVWKKQGDTLLPARIKIGPTDGAYTAVLEGELQEGDEIITSMQGGGDKMVGASPLGGGAARGPRGPF